MATVIARAGFAYAPLFLPISSAVVHRGEAAFCKVWRFVVTVRLLTDTEQQLYNYCMSERHAMQYSFQVA